MILSFTSVEKNIFKIVLDKNPELVSAINYEHIFSFDVGVLVYIVLLWRTALIISTQREVKEMLDAYHVKGT